MVWYGLVNGIMVQIQDTLLCVVHSKKGICFIGLVFEFLIHLGAFNRVFAIILHVVFVHMYIEKRQTYKFVFI